MSANPPRTSNMESRLSSFVPETSMLLGVPSTATAQRSQSPGDWAYTQTLRLCEFCSRIEAEFADSKLACYTASKNRTISGGKRRAARRATRSVGAVHDGAPERCRLAFVGHALLQASPFGFFYNSTSCKMSGVVASIGRARLSIAVQQVPRNADYAHWLDSQ